jgi:hypothetical protein
MSKKRDTTALAQQFARWLAEQDQVANDDEPAIDEDAIRERVRKITERVRRARGHR